MTQLTITDKLRCFNILQDCMTSILKFKQRLLFEFKRVIMLMFSMPGAWVCLVFGNVFVNVTSWPDFSIASCSPSEKRY